MTGDPLRALIRDVPDFPKPGILFRDVSPLLADAAGWRMAVDRLAWVLRPLGPTKLAGIESRGFLLAAPLALELGCGFFMVRKAGKLPGATHRLSYDLEYGQDALEVQVGAVRPGERVVVLDDLLATGGTAAATVALLRQLGAEVASVTCLIELAFLGGRARLGDVPFHALVTFED